MIKLTLRSIHIVLASAVFVVCSSTLAFCQAPALTADYIDPASAYHTGDFDYVDVVNHRLAFNLPLFADHSQRGKLNFVFSLRYASTTEWVPVVYNPYYGYQRWTPAGGFIAGPRFSMDGNLI